MILKMEILINFLNNLKIFEMLVSSFQKILNYYLVTQFLEYSKKKYSFFYFYYFF